MKLLSLCPLYQNGGASRLLRRLYEGRESQIITLAIRANSIKPQKGKISEIDLPIYPLQQKWMRWKFRSISTYLRDEFFFNYNSKRILNTVKKIEFDTIHVINHGVYCNSFYDKKYLDNKKIWVSFHDHYRLCSSVEDAKFLWNIADRRLVISEDLAKEYEKTFGKKKYEIITDGVDIAELSVPVKSNPKVPQIIYFAGLLHIDYYSLFKVLADALDLMSIEEKRFKLILRGTQELPLLTNRKFEVEYRKNFITDIEIKEELDQAAILYLPIKFSSPDFYLYSLSTKLVSYLGGSGAILYHGPEDAVACNLLKKNNAAGICITLNVNDLVTQIKNTLEKTIEISEAAIKLVNHSFDLTVIQKRFWEIDKL
ncbi:MAG: glycosyltransferase [Paludibacter sp.]|nr:glycosyltransferase [Paludibacter sp.]